MSNYTDVQMNEAGNVIVRYQAEHGVPAHDIKVGTFWEPVILWLGTKFPKWTFVGTRLISIGHSDFFTPKMWTVMCGDEELGKLSRDSYASKPCYVIENHRIASKRTRGYADKTVKVDTARKTVMKNFRPKDLKERVVEAMDGVYGEVRSAGYMAHSEWRRPYTALMEFMGERMMERFDELSKEAVSMGFNAEKLPKLKNAWEEMKIKQGVTECHNKKAGAVVLIHGSTYAVRSDNGQFSVFESATLPDQLKRKIGLLKLLEPDNYLIDVGYRRRDDTFYVCLEDTDGTN